MNREEEQKTLLQIVETWRPNEVPEYRGFRCANCQEYKNEAWYHWINTVGWHLPIHLCNDKCELAFWAGTINVEGSNRGHINRSKFGNNYQYSETAKKRFREIIASWPEYAEPKLKAFSCDHCGQDLIIEKLADGSKQRRGYHVWWKEDDGQTLVELHFHRDCGRKVGI